MSAWWAEETEVEGQCKTSGTLSIQVLYRKHRLSSSENLEEETFSKSWRRHVVLACRAILVECTGVWSQGRWRCLTSCTNLVAALTGLDSILRTIWLVNEDGVVPKWYCQGTKVQSCCLVAWPFSTMTREIWLDIGLVMREVYATESSDRRVERVHGYIRTA